MRRPPALSLYELRRHPPRRGLGRSTGTRPTRAFAWQLTVEGIVWAAVVYRFLTWGLGLKW